MATGITAAIEALGAAVVAVQPITEPDRKFRMRTDVRAPSVNATAYMRTCHLRVIGDEGSTASGWHLRRRYRVELVVDYPSRGRKDDSALYLEDQARLARAIHLSNDTGGDLVGIASVGPTEPPEFEDYIPDGADESKGVRMIIPFVVETREAEPT